MRLGFCHRFLAGLLTASARRVTHFFELQVPLAEPHTHLSLPCPFDRHTPASLAWPGRWQELIAAALEADRVIIGHHPLVLLAEHL